MESTGNSKTAAEKLSAWQKLKVAEARENGEEFFLNFPDNWYEPYPLWGCESGHLSRMYLKSETRGTICLSCKKPLYLIPKITEEELKKIVSDDSES